jgi:ribosome-associated protein
MTRSATLFASELKFTYIRSPGPGGQNVNKVATGVQLRFNVKNSLAFTEEKRDLLLQALKSKLTLEGDLIIKATRYRTQGQNKEDALERLYAILNKALIVPKKRKKTKPSKRATEERLDKKKKRSGIKSMRRDNPKNEI